MNSAPHVLIIDRSAEARDVLRTLLERRGMVALEAERPAHALLLTQDVRPDLIVLDADSDSPFDGESIENLCEVAGHNDTPIVILGTLRGPRNPRPARPPPA